MKILLSMIIGLFILAGTPYVPQLQQSANASNSSYKYYICYTEQRTRLTMPTRGWHVYRECIDRGQFPASAAKSDRQNPSQFCAPNLFRTFGSESTRDQWWESKCNRWTLETFGDY